MFDGAQAVRGGGQSRHRDVAIDAISVPLSVAASSSSGRPRALVQSLVILELSAFASLFVYAPGVLYDY